MTLEEGLAALWNAFIATSIALIVLSLLITVAVFLYLGAEYLRARYYMWRRRDPFTKNLIARRRAQRR